MNWIHKVISMIMLLLGGVSLANADNSYFEIEVVDDQSGRGVPLVELETVNHLRYVTDSAGRVAFFEPGLMNQTVFFYVRSHGYEMSKDGFGYPGVRLETKPGTAKTVRIKRLNLAERLYRVTGEGIYRDTALLGKQAPIAQPLIAGLVAGQDSVQAIPYREKLYWFWGDTLRMSYPLGQFYTSGATSDFPARGGLQPGIGVDLRYFTNADGFSRPMCPLEQKEGTVWVDGLLTVPDEQGHERMVIRYSRWKKLGEMLEQGIAVFNDEKAIFERVLKLPIDEAWRKPENHPVRYRDGGTDYYSFGTDALNVRVKADWKSILDPSQYEAWTCLEKGDVRKPKSIEVTREKNGEPRYSWRRDRAPIDPGLERELIQQGKIRKEEARYQPIDVESGKTIPVHFASIRWNPYRQRWIAIALQHGAKTSFLGEVYYSEAPAPTGPWLRARKIVTHNQYSFYNPVQHEFFDEQGGRIIYFEGTYSETFSGNPFPTARYDYNQVMYRLDLQDSRLRLE